METTKYGIKSIGMVMADGKFHECNSMSMEEINASVDNTKIRGGYGNIDSVDNYICITPRYNDNYIDFHNIAYIKDENKDNQEKKDLIKSICNIVYCNTDLTKLSVEKLKEIKEKVYEKLYKVVNNKTEI